MWWINGLERNEEERERERVKGDDVNWQGKGGFGMIEGGERERESIIRVKERAGCVYTIHVCQVVKKTLTRPGWPL
jgi:hypothetical protein